jgi:hypothetical protein
MRPIQPEVRPGSLSPASETESVFRLRFPPRTVEKGEGVTNDPVLLRLPFHQ